MNATDLIRRLHAHRMWANRQLLEAAAALSHEQLHRALAIGQGSVWRTLTHLLAADFVWLEALLGNDQARLPGDVAGKLPGNQEGPRAIVSLDELATKWSALDARWNEYLGALQESSLDEPVYRVSSSSQQGQRIATRRADVLLHVCTHAQYTTAQMVNMLRQLGADRLPNVMLISLARQEANRDSAARSGE